MAARAYSQRIREITKSNTPDLRGRRWRPLTDDEAEVGPEQRAWLMRLQPETLEWYGEPIFRVIVKDGASKKAEPYRVLVQGRELFIIPESVYQRLADRL